MKVKSYEKRNSVFAILTLDFGQHIGWGLRDRRGEITSGEHENRTVSHEALRSWLDDLEQKSGGLSVVFFFQHSISQTCADELIDWCGKRGVPCDRVAPSLVGRCALLSK